MIKRLALAMLVLGFVSLVGTWMPMPVQASMDEGNAREIQLVLADPAKGEFTFNPNLIELKNGETIKLNLQNKGKIDHELMSDLFQWANDVEVEVPGVGSMAMPKIYEVELKAAQTVSVTFQVQVDEHIMEEKGGASGKVQFEFGCYLKDHYKNGMKGTFVIQGGQ